MSYFAGESIDPNVCDIIVSIVHIKLRRYDSNIYKTRGLDYFEDIVI